MREIRTSGSVRGASGNGRPYRERVPPVAVRPGEGPLTPTNSGRSGLSAGTAPNASFETTPLNRRVGWFPEVADLCRP